ncbi:MAG TPA: phytanoyl-CoA dioxygenase family protein [Acetobacteraceae bacterium]|nr:phytanoyl-CoA dioxygenase family protein [Acetobacteraceae bacterium]
MITNTTDARMSEVTATSVPAREARLSAEELAAFWRDGYIATPTLSPEDELRAIRATYDQLFAQRTGEREGQMFDTLGHNDGKAQEMLLPQMFTLSRHAPWLRESALQRNLLAIARQILGPETELVAEFAILKPPGRNAPTPWHQDEAFFDFRTPYDECVSAWVALQEAGAEHGCMQYVPGSNHGPLLTHRSPDGDTKKHGLEVVGADLSKAVAAPLHAGQASVHHCRTLHGAGANLTREARRGYTLVYAVPRSRLWLRRSPPWNRGRWTPRDEAELRALPMLRRIKGQIRKAMVKLGV